jgi:hypothetical protein
MDEVRKCFKCGDEIPPQRIKILPKTNVCVKCSDTPTYKGKSVQLGTGDHCWNELVIVSTKGENIV